MYHPLINQISKSRKNLPYDINSLLLIKLIFFQVLRKICLAVLHNHVQRVVFLHYIVQFNNVWMVQLPQDRSLVADSSKGIGLKINRQLFDGIGRGVVDLAKRTLSEHRLQDILALSILTSNYTHFSNQYTIIIKPHKEK